MPESNEQQPKSKTTEETTPPYFLNECRQFLHTATARLEEFRDAVIAWKAAKEKGTDWIARGLALAALGVAVFAALVLHFKQVDMIQEANPTINVDGDRSKELEDARLRDISTAILRGDYAGQLPTTGATDSDEAIGDSESPSGHHQPAGADHQ